MREHLQASPGFLPAPQPSMASFALYFLRLGALGFGGPIALAAYMQRDLVEERRWVSSQDYAEGLAFAQLSPGPLAAQLAMYLGWVRGGPAAALLIAIAFILPSFLVVLLIAWLYAHFGQLPWIRGLFNGIAPVTMAIIIVSAYKLVQRMLARDWLLWAIFLALAITTAWTETEIVWLIVASGLVVVLLRTPPRISSGALLPLPLSFAGPALAGGAAAATEPLVSLFLLFLKAGAFVFGSGLAIVPFLYAGVVVESGWLNERQFLDAVAVAMITPGPVVIIAAFVGYLVGGFLGAAVASFAVFAPPYVIVILGAPHFRRFAQNTKVKAFVQGVTAAAVGAIAGAAFVIGRRTLADPLAIAIAVVSLGVLLTAKRVSEPVLIIAGGLIGLLSYWAL